MFLSALVLTLTGLALSNGGSEQAGARTVKPVVLCASNCDVTKDAAEQSPSLAMASGNEVAHLGEMVVSATRLPAPLGHPVVSATRLPQESFPTAPLARASTADAR